MYQFLDGVRRVIGWIWAAYNVYMTVVLFIAGPVLVMGVLTMLALWFGFGIRWGW